MLMRRLGRRTAYVFGALIGVAAGSVAALGIVSAGFALFCLGTFLAGWWASFVQSYRFAATDAAPDRFRAQAISWVMIGGLVAGVIGPQTVIWSRDLVDGIPFAGGFLGQAGLALLSIPVLAWLRPTPVASTPKAGGRPLGVIMRQPRFVTAVVTGLVSYGLMSFMMTAAPMAMVECGHAVGDAALGIQWHILAMFGPSFVTGRLIGRFGKERITALGLVLIALAGAVGLAGITVAHFWSALILLGIGWNFGFIGATALVTDCYRPEERTKVQAANDFLVFGSVAVASFASGKLLHTGGWEVVTWLVFPPVLAALALLAWQASRRAVPA
jgi:MFS family permease